MKDMHQLLVTFLRARFGDRERGANLVEYCFLVALIAIVCFAAVTFLGSVTSSDIDEMGRSLAK
jgi:Flp pilus assembly pilin Flp